MHNVVGQEIASRYRVDEFLGRGGMAEVYKVWDQRRATTLAMKLLHEDLALDRVFIDRFRREADNLARLQHPNIVRFYGLEQDDRLAFMLLDYVEGETLKHKIFDARGPTPPRDIRWVMRAVCSALQFAHSEGLVHCDIKPANIMINHHGTVLLSDFGIARLTDAATATMVGMGTPAYMAPEQIKGRDPVPQTDMYALGVVLFEMLTGGKRPFTGDQASTTGTTSAKVRWEQVNLEPPSPRKYTTDLSPELEDVVLTCLEKDPADRYRTALEMFNALERAVGSTRAEEADSEQGVLELETKIKPEPSHVQPANLQPVTSASEAPAQLEPNDSERASFPTQNWWQRSLTWVGLGGVLILLAAVFGIQRWVVRPAQTIVVETVLVERESGTKVAAQPSQMNAKQSEEASAPSGTLLPTQTNLPQVTNTPVLTVGDTQKSEKDNMVMVFVPAGEFLMGSDADEGWVACQEMYEAISGEKCQRKWFEDEDPRHLVTLDAYWIDQYEVSNAQFAEFLNARGNKKEGGEYWLDDDDKDVRIVYEEGLWQPISGFGNHPVVEVTWYGARLLCMGWAAFANRGRMGKSR